MDVSEFINPGFGDPVSQAFFVAGVAFVTGMMTSIVVMVYRPDVRPRLSLTFALVCLGCTAITLIAADSHASASEADRNAGFESALSDGYGFTAGAGGPGVDEIQAAGEEGVATQLNRDGNTHDVLLRISDGRLIIAGSDGLEIPVNA